MSLPLMIKSAYDRTHLLHRFPSTQFLNTQPASSTSSNSSSDEDDNDKISPTKTKLDLILNIMGHNSGNPCSNINTNNHLSQSSNSCNNDTDTCSNNNNLNNLNHTFNHSFSNSYNGNNNSNSFNNSNSYDNNNANTRHLCPSSKGKQKRVRTIFTPYQLERLEQEFAVQMYLVGIDRLKLAKSLGLSEAQVKVWFQNRRIKFRKLNPSPFLSIKHYEDNNISTTTINGSSDHGNMNHDNNITTTTMSNNSAGLPPYSDNYGSI